ncbi:MAG: DUF4250 domain-containing protein [Bacilli bacterium]|nr:DUF4250 domain-containing protein [Bacilli bacterium]
MIKDPNILLSFINTKLRDFYSSLDLLCEDLDLDKEEIIRILKSIDYYYDEKDNTFKLLKKDEK